MCRSAKKNGALAAFEEGNCPHFHMLVVAAIPIKFKALQAKFNHSEIEPLRGTIDETVAYLYKEGKHVDKQDTQKCVPVCWGECFSDNEEPLEDKPVFSEIDELIEQGLRPRDIYKYGSKFAFYRNAIETAYSARMALTIPDKRKITVYFHIGKSNTGKSYEYWRLCEKHTPEQVYFVNGEYRNIWDLYSYEPVVFLDDFRGSHMPLTSLLGLLDEYPTVTRCRYADKRLAFTEIYLTSVVPPEELYPYAGREEFEQLKRRITYVVYHYRNDTCEGEGRF